MEAIKHCLGQLSQCSFDSQRMRCLLSLEQHISHQTISNQVQMHHEIPGIVSVLVNQLFTKESSLQQVISRVLVLVLTDATLLLPHIACAKVYYESHDWSKLVGFMHVLDMQLDKKGFAQRFSMVHTSFIAALVNSGLVASQSETLAQMLAFLTHCVSLPVCMLNWGEIIQPQAMISVICNIQNIGSHTICSQFLQFFHGLLLQCENKIQIQLLQIQPIKLACIIKYSLDMQAFVFISKWSTIYPSFALHLAQENLHDYLINGLISKGKAPIQCLMSLVAMASPETHSLLYSPYVVEKCIQLLKQWAEESDFSRMQHMISLITFLFQTEYVPCTDLPIQTEFIQKDIVSQKANILSLFRPFHFCSDHLSFWSTLLQFYQICEDPLEGLLQFTKDAVKCSQDIITSHEWIQVLQWMAKLLSQNISRIHDTELLVSIISMFHTIIQSQELIEDVLDLFICIFSSKSPNTILFTQSLFRMGFVDTVFTLNFHEKLVRALISMYESCGTLPKSHQEQFTMGIKSMPTTAHDILCLLQNVSINAFTGPLGDTLFALAVMLFSMANTDAYSVILKQIFVSFMSCVNPFSINDSVILEMLFCQTQYAKSNNMGDFSHHTLPDKLQFESITLKWIMHDLDMIPHTLSRFYHTKHINLILASPFIHDILRLLVSNIESEPGAFDLVNQCMNQDPNLCHPLLQIVLHHITDVPIGPMFVQLLVHLTDQPLPPCVVGTLIHQLETLLAKTPNAFGMITQHAHLIAITCHDTSIPAASYLIHSLCHWLNKTVHQDLNSMCESTYCPYKHIATVTQLVGVIGGEISNAMIHRFLNISCTHLVPATLYYMYRQCHTMRDTNILFKCANYILSGDSLISELATRCYTVFHDASNPLLQIWEKTITAHVVQHICQNANVLPFVQKHGTVQVEEIDFEQLTSLFLLPFEQQQNVLAFAHHLLSKVPLPAKVAIQAIYTHCQMIESSPLQIQVLQICEQHLFLEM